MSATPRLPDAVARPDASALPLPGTEQLGALVVALSHEGVGRLAVGSGRDAGSRETAAACTRLWQQLGGEVVARVDWPESAASWLRQARRLTDPEPDVWLLGGPVAGLAQAVRRLAWSTAWDPARTVGFGAGWPEVRALAGQGTVTGLRWVDAGGAERVLA